MIAALVLAAASSAAATAPAPPPAWPPLMAELCQAPQPGFPLLRFDTRHCPQVWRVAGNAPVDQALNIVVIGDGFTVNELPMYRCAVGLTVNAMLAAPPFDRYAGSVNVYRVDLVTQHSGVAVPAICGGQACDHEPPVWPKALKAAECTALELGEGFGNVEMGIPTRPQGAFAANCMTVGFDTQACPETAQECQLVWPSGEGLRKLWRIAACAPAFDAVVLLANSGSWGGGGAADLRPPLAVATLVGIDNEGTRGRLLAHELGHALGLLDEYPASQAFSAESGEPAYEPGRNLVKAAADGTLPPIPWAASCTPPPAGAPAVQGCQKICAPSCADCTAPAPDPQSMPAVGLYEGGYYAACGVYRSSATCMMVEPDPGTTFCAGCRWYFDGLFKDMGLAAPSPAP